MSRRLAVLLGYAGQDGRLLWQRLNDLGYALVGIGRGAASSSRGEWSDPVDISSATEVEHLIRMLRPGEVYHLAAHHTSAEGDRTTDREEIERSFAVNVSSLAHLLDAVRRHSPDTRVFYAASSHMFGRPSRSPQDELCPLEPRTIYGISKAAATHLCRLYRHDHRVFVSVGILFNHESPYRRPSFLSRRIIDGALAAARAEGAPLVLGNLDAEVDWGWAPEYVDAMHRILQLGEPADFVVATGRRRSVRDFVDLAYKAVGLDWRRHVREDPGRLSRGTTGLVGDPARLRSATGWTARVELEELVALLLAAASDGADDGDGGRQ